MCKYLLSGLFLFSFSIGYEIAEEAAKDDQGTISYDSAKELADYFAYLFVIALGIFCTFRLTELVAFFTLQRWSSNRENFSPKHQKGAMMEYDDTKLKSYFTQLNQGGHIDGDSIDDSRVKSM